MSTSPTDSHTAASPSPTEPQPQLLPIRRSVKYVPFLATGALIGFVLGSLYGRFGPGAAPSAGAFANGMQASGAGYSSFAGIAYLGALGTIVGVLVAAVVAIALDRRR